MKSIHCAVGKNSIGAPKFHISYRSVKTSRFGSVVAHTDLEGGGVSGPGHTKDFKNGTYCCAGHNELE